MDVSPDDPENWDIPGYGHWVSLGKTEEGTPILLDTQIPESSDKPNTFSTFLEFFDYFLDGGYYGISVIDCFWSPNGKSDHPERVEYLENEGELGMKSIYRRWV